MAAAAPPVEDILGEWQFTTQMGGNENTAVIEFSMQDGALAAEVKGDRGSIPAKDPSYENGTLTWGLALPQLQGQVIETEVTVKDDGTFEGLTKTPIGELPVTGKRLTEDMKEKAASIQDKLIGDWNIWTTYEGEQFGSKMRFQRERDGDLVCTIRGRGSDIEIDRIRLGDGKMMMFIAEPFFSDDPARLEVEFNEAQDEFKGVLHSKVGNLDIIGEFVNTEELVLAPYDDPEQILGDWDVIANIEGDEQHAVLNFFPKGERVGATITTDDGTEYDVHNVEYKKVNDQMSVVRLEVTIPDLGTEPQVYEMIIDGDSFEGEELHSGGKQFITGHKMESGGN